MDLRKKWIKLKKELDKVKEELDTNIENLRKMRENNIKSDLDKQNEETKHKNNTENENQESVL